MNLQLLILPELLILSGVVIMFFAIRRLRKSMLLPEVSKYKKNFKVQIALVIFFLFGYLTVAFMIYLGMEKFLSLITGIVFFFGALFVYLVIHTCSLTLGDVRKSQDGMELAIQKRTSELQNEIDVRKKSEENFRALSESSPLMILRIDKNGIIQYINQVVPPFKREEIVGQSIYHFIDPSGKKMYEKNLNLVFNDQQIVRFEVKGIRANKEMGWYFSTIAPIKGKSGIDSAIVLTSDITEQKHTQEQLVETVALLHAIFDSAIEGILVVDKENKIVTFNKRFSELWQIPDEVLNTKDDNRALAFVLRQLKDPEKFVNKVKELYNQPEVDSFDIIEFKDGRVLERYSMPERRDGVIVGRVWNFIDVTETKKAEEVIKLSQEKYRKLVEEVVDVVYSVDTKGHFTYINPACKKLTGYKESELLGKHYSELISPAWRAQVTEFYKNQSQNKLQETVLSFAITTKSGKEQWVEQTVNQVYHGNTVAGYQAICRDITERKLMEAKLESSNKDLENFAYIASHDLQEPLRMVTSFLGLLEHNLEGKLDKDSEEFIDFALDGANRMRNMINDLLSYSRITSRKAEFKKIDMNQILKDVLLNLKEKISESHAEITSGTLPEITGDDIKITRLFQNLINNAIKFAQQDKKAEVKIGYEDRGNSWLFFVKDNGIGIKKDHFDKIFVIFKRLHSKEEYPGTGIGLAECKKIVELHNGTIWVESEEGNGSTFYFTIKKDLELI